MSADYDATETNFTDVNWIVVSVQVQIILSVVFGLLTYTGHIWKGNNLKKKCSSLGT